MPCTPSTTSSSSPLTKKAPDASRHEKPTIIRPKDKFFEPTCSPSREDPWWDAEGPFIEIKPLRSAANPRTSANESSFRQLSHLPIKNPSSMNRKTRSPRKGIHGNHCSNHGPDPEYHKWVVPQMHLSQSHPVCITRELQRSSSPSRNRARHRPGTNSIGNPPLSVRI